jgi:hypothetical protein
MSRLAARYCVWLCDAWLHLGIQRVGEQRCQDPMARDTPTALMSEPSNIRLCRPARSRERVLAAITIVQPMPAGRCMRWRSPLRIKAARRLTGIQERSRESTNLPR